MVFALDDNNPTLAKLKVIGVGGAGGNALNRMIHSGLTGVEFIAVNTDALALEHNAADIKLQIGTKLTSGLGAGANPQVGMMSLQEDRERIKAQIEGADMIFIAAGMGGGTGTGAAPVVAEIAREMGILAVAVVTRPFIWEGPVREKNALAGLDALRKSADTVIVVPNQKLLSVVNKNTPLRQAFKLADEVLTSATRGISEIILKHGDIQVDFADVRAVMSQGGDALMGTGTANGENRATIAADRAIHSPLLDNVSIAGATGVLVNITGGEDLGIMEISDAMNYIYEAVGNESNANIIFGTVINPDMKDDISITVIATGFGPSAHQKQSQGARLGLSASSAPLRRPGQAYLGEGKPASVEPLREMPRVEKPAAPSHSAYEEPFGSGSRFSFAAAPQNDAPSRLNLPGTEAANENEEIRPQADQEDLGTRKNTIPFFGSSQKGRYKDHDSDVDYETPAFLRHQAD